MLSCSFSAKKKGYFYLSASKEKIQKIKKQNIKDVTNMTSSASNRDFKLTYEATTKPKLVIYLKKLKFMPAF